MVEKIDRPDPPTPYRIAEAKQTKEDQHQSRNPREEAEAKYQKILGEKEWGKFHRREITIKPVRCPRSHISRCLFRSMVLKSGAALLVVDLLWANGQSTNGALILLGKLDDYFKLKHLRPGEEVPEAFWVRGDEVEVGIPQEMGSGPFSAPPQKGKDIAPSPPEPTHAWPSWFAWGFINPVTGKLEWPTIAGILIAITILILAIIQAMS